MHTALCSTNGIEPFFRILAFPLCVSCPGFYSHNRAICCSPTFIHPSLVPPSFQTASITLATVPFSASRGARRHRLLSLHHADLASSCLAVLRASHRDSPFAKPLYQTFRCPCLEPRCLNSPIMGELNLQQLLQQAFLHNQW